MVKAIDELNSIFKDGELALLGLHRNEPLWGDGFDGMADVMALDVNNYMPGNTFVKIDSDGLFSIIGTCLYAAA